jgi:hypothetical protein
MIAVAPYCSIMSFSCLKRDRDDDEDPKFAKRQRPRDPLHPHFLLEYFVLVVLRSYCKNDAVKNFYRDELDNPEVAIAICKRYLEDWVLELYEKGTLYNRQESVSRRLGSIFDLTLM